MKPWTEKDYEGCDTPRTAGMLINRGMDPRSKAPFVEFTRQLEREVEELKKKLAVVPENMRGPKPYTNE